MRIRIGTAGFSYPAWVGDFYPPGTPQDEWLEFYATRFPLVEINATFYRPQTPDQAARMARRVPPGFAFSLKVPRSASHDRDPGELPAFARAAAEYARAGKLLGLVVQFPEAFRNEPNNRGWLARVRELLADFPLAVEFRHKSWDVPALPAWADSHALTVASVGVPDLPTLFPAGLRFNGGRVYARLHSENPDGWYAGGEARYDYDYPASTLQRWADGLRAAADQGVTEAAVFFNNCVGVQATENAEKLAGLLRGVPGVEVVPPPEAPRERSLFDGL